MIAIATIPFGGTLPLFGRDVKLVIADLDIGILWVFAVGSLSVYGILLAGWSSGNKFAFLGGLRSSAQIISYELGLTLSVVGVLLWTRTGDAVWWWCGALGLLAALAAHAGVRLRTSTPAAVVEGR